MMDTLLLVQYLTRTCLVAHNPGCILGFKSFCSVMQCFHILIHVDSTAAVVYISSCIYMNSNNPFVIELVTVWMKKIYVSRHEFAKSDKFISDCKWWFKPFLIHLIEHLNAWSDQNVMCMCNWNGIVTYDAWNELMLLNHTCYTVNDSF